MKVSSAAVTVAVQNREAALKEARRAEEYPALPSVSSVATGRPLRGTATPQAGGQMLDAFSEEEDEDSPVNGSEDAPDDATGGIDIGRSPRDAATPAFGACVLFLAVIDMNSPSLDALRGYICCVGFQPIHQNIYRHVAIRCFNLFCCSQ